MTTAGRPFCWPCRHYRPPSLPPGTIPGEWSAGTCAAFPDGILGIIVAGGFDHRDPHPHDNGVRFEIRTDERFDWDERQTHDFLDDQLRRYRQRERRIKALGMKVGPPARAADKGPRHEGGAMTDAPPDKGALQRFTAPIPVRTGEDADRAAAAWEEYRLTGDPEFLYEAGIWVRPELTDLPPDGGERLVAPMPIATGEEGEVVAAAWEEYARTGDGEALHAALGRIYGYGGGRVTDAEVPASPQDPRPFPSMVTGEAGERLARAYRRWRESGYDRRLAPTAHPDEERQTAYDAWDRGQWPPDES